VYERYPSWGEYSGQPAYATRFSWIRSLHGQELTIGAGGYYAASFGDTAVAWTAGRARMDLKLPLGRLLNFTSQIYRGRAVEALAGASDRVFFGMDLCLTQTLQVHAFSHWEVGATEV